MSRDAIDNPIACEQLGADIVNMVSNRIAIESLSARDAIVTMLSASIAVCRAAGATDEQAADLMRNFSANVSRTVDAHRKAAN